MMKFDYIASINKAASLAAVSAIYDHGLHDSDLDAADYSDVLDCGNKRKTEIDPNWQQQADENGNIE